MVQKESAKFVTNKKGDKMYAVTKENVKCNKKVKVKAPGTKICTKVVYVKPETAKEMGISENGFLSPKDVEEWQRKLRNEKARKAKEGKK